MNGKWWSGVMVVTVMACGTPPRTLDCTEDRDCYADEYCDLSTLKCANWSDGGIDAGHLDAGTHDGGTRDAGVHDGGGTDGGMPDGGDEDGGDDAGVGCTPNEVCRYATGPCDLEERCTSAGECPPDLFEMNTTLCRPADAGVACDAPEYCTGGSAQCPDDGPAVANTLCRADAGDCDVEERCDGVSFECPPDLKAPYTTLCRASAGGCDQEEYCTGVDVSCPVDTIFSSQTTCRFSSGACDPAEKCDGVSVGCPADRLLDAGVVCRAAAGVCDAAETCTGTAPGCPADGFLPSTTSCRSAANTCDLAESCTGSSAACPADTFQSSSFVCAAQTCAGGTVTPQRVCAGTSATCNAAGANISCNGYACTGNTCRTNCSSSSDCITSTHFCDVNQCSPLRADGAVCSGTSSGFQCLSGSCIQVYTDGDHDGYGTGTPVFHCGTAATTGFSTNNTDCCDTDANAKPGQTAYFTSARTGCGGYDYDCSGAETQQYTTSGVCQSTGTCATRACPSEGTQGWSGSTPACGVSGTWITNCGITPLGGSCSGGESCNIGSSTSRTQGCR